MGIIVQLPLCLNTKLTYITIIGFNLQRMY